MSWEKDLCEECGQLKRVVITERLWSRAQRTVAEAVENLKKG